MLIFKYVLATIKLPKLCVLYTILIFVKHLYNVPLASKIYFVRMFKYM